MAYRQLVPLTEVTDKEPTWLWPGLIPFGAITILEGDGGCAKSRVAYDLVARVTAGVAMPFEDHLAPPAGAVVLEAEDLVGGTVKGVLKASYADLGRVFVYERKRFRSEPLVLPDDLPLIEEAIKAVDAKLVVIDPLAAFVDVDLNRERHARHVLGPLAALAEEKEIAVLCIRHWTKASSDNLAHRGAGSFAILASARSALAVLPDPSSDEPYRHVLHQSKTNLTGAEHSMAYRTIKAGTDIVVEWIGPCPCTIQALSAADDKHSALIDACYFLHLTLSQGPLLFVEVMRTARDAGISRSTLYRAKRVLKVRSYKQHQVPWGSWTWRFSDDDDPVLQPFKDRALAELTDALVNSDQP